MSGETRFRQSMQSAITAMQAGGRSMRSDHPNTPRAYSEFSRVLDPTIYEALPDDWLVGITDVVGSTSAIKSGRYEDVNYAGASVIAAVGNAWGDFDFPFVFRGDGAAFALPPQGIMTATSALRQVSAFAKADLNLALRAGLLTVGEIRANGRDVRIARYAASENATYAMFAGGGLKWAERQIKNGRYLVKPGSYTTKPDLTGLTCDWEPFLSQRGEILSLLVSHAKTGARKPSRRWQSACFPFSTPERGRPNPCRGIPPSPRTASGQSISKPGRRSPPTRTSANMTMACVSRWIARANRSKQSKPSWLRQRRAAR
ncbi:hypothetical protein J2W42_004916 [Rhizobium tibeticum]|nr:hypothetical protein [Rhizobium tibeticum]